ncbi:MAG: helix-turn-helix domain-containing protein [Anaerolineae bacterium]|jgi:DNA-binding transcriptional regulator GbsR (MarR family)|nr:helix-turn-helix domain-containing protein [Anaerolineae bacterium]
MSDEHENLSVKITNKDLITVHTTMLDGLSQLSDYFGFSKVMGQLYGALLMSGEPLSLDDLMDTLNISKASVSMNIRTLEHMGMVRQVWVRGKGGRRKYYEAETDFLQIMANILNGREMRDVDRALHVMQDNITRLNKSLENMTPEEREIAEVYVQRIQQLQRMFRFAQIVITSILARVGELNLDSISEVEIH